MYRNTYVPAHGTYYVSMHSQYFAPWNLISIQVVPSGSWVPSPMPLTLRPAGTIPCQNFLRRPLILLLGM